MSEARIDPSPASLRVKKTLCQRSCRRSSLISPSTHTVGSRCSHEPTPRLNAETVKTRRSPYSIASTFIEAIVGDGLDEDLCGEIRRAACPNEPDRLVQVGVRVR